MAYRPPSEKWHLFENVRQSHAERFICCALTIRYITYSMVGRSIASIYPTSAAYLLRHFVPR